MPNSSIKEHIRTLNQIIAYGNTIPAIPYGEKLAEFVYEAFKSINNIERCTVCLKHLPKSIGNLSDENCSNCKFPSSPDKYPCELKSKTQVKKIVIGTFQNEYGHIAFEVNPDFSDELLSILHNFANTVAITIENHFQKSELKKQNSELSAAKQRIEKDHQFLERLNNSLINVVFTVRFSDKKIKYVNNSIKNVFGYLPEDCVNKNTNFLYPGEENYSDFGNKLQKAIENNQDSFTTEHIFKRKNGETFPAEVTTTFLKENENITDVIFIINDITKRKKADQALKESEAQKEAILNGISARIGFLDTDFRFIWTNNASAKSVDLHPDEMMGQQCYRLWANTEKVCQGCPAEKAMKTGKKVYNTVTTPDGKIWEASGNPIFDDN